MLKRIASFGQRLHDLGIRLMVDVLSQNHMPDSERLLLMNLRLNSPVLAAVEAEELADRLAVERFFARLGPPNYVI